MFCVGDSVWVDGGMRSIVGVEHRILSLMSANIMMVTLSALHSLLSLIA